MHEAGTSNTHTVRLCSRASCARRRHQQHIQRCQTPGSNSPAFQARVIGTQATQRMLNTMASILKDAGMHRLCTGLAAHGYTTKAPYNTPCKQCTMDGRKNTVGIGCTHKGHRRHMCKIVPCCANTCLWVWTHNMA